MKSQRVTIVNKLGLHARAAAKLVSLASGFSSEIEVEHGERRVNGKSIMGVMMLAASRGKEIIIHAEGDDENKALQQLCSLVANRFGEAE
ncbi:MAG: HPr family phosphocarrier protein [Gammaproteobacteria bacterium]|nr:HPr family phosphocarrier protein [Gammaproteobacteria bacterium]MCF6231183.1 HPr family phosphocarrier protein [Gammaproteobacteria bacterium]